VGGSPARGSLVNNVKEENEAMTDGSIADDELAELVRHTEEAAKSLIRGDMDRYLALTHHAPGYTLMQPFGGPPTRYENRAESVRASADYFKGGDAKLESVETHVWGDTVVLVLIERQHGQVGGLPDQDWSLRVTQVYRRDGSDWQLVHRHADPLVHPIDLEQAAALARG
jgi:ketosteroid isomerase-like protein